MLVFIMKQIVLPDYNELTSALNQTALKLHPSQVHGLINGILCGSLDAKVAWEDLITGGEKKTGKVHDILLKLYQASAKQLAEFLFEVTLVLPGDDESLPNRAEALTLWCQGFLTGLKIVHVKITDREASDVTEAIDDLIEIAKMSYENVVASEEDETAYNELLEFVRMAVILIYQDLHEGKLSPAKVSKHLH